MASDQKIHFSKDVHVMVDGVKVDLPARRNDWVEFAFDEPVSTLQEGLYGGGQRVITESQKGTLTVRVLAGSRWGNFEVPKLRRKTLDDGYFRVTLIDQNKDTKLTLETDFAGLTKYPDTKRGGPDLNDIEVAMDGFWKIVTG